MALIRPLISRGRPEGRAGGLDVRIDELVLHGFADSDRYAIAEAIERELARLLREHAVPGWLDWAAGRGGVAVQRLDAGAFEVPDGAGPGVVGAQLARALHDGLTVGQHPRRGEAAARSATHTRQVPRRGEGDVR